MYQYLYNSIVNDNRERIVYYKRSIDSAALLSYIDKTASFLAEIGIKSGDTVGIALPNIPEAIIALYAINKIGAIANLINPRIAPKAMENLLVETKTKAIFLYDKLVETLNEALENNNIFGISCSVSNFIPLPLKAIVRLTEPIIAKVPTFASILRKNYVNTAQIPLGKLDGETLSVYIHSGGTTGVPKTVAHTNRGINALASAVMDTVYRDIPPSKRSDSMLMMLPIFHGFGLGICVHTIICNLKIVLMPQFKAKSAIRLIKRHRITHLAGVPAMFRKMLHCASFDGAYIATLQHIFCGGEALSSDIKRAFDEILARNGSTAELAEGYGLSETASVFSLTRSGESVANSQGKPLRGNRILIVDEQMQPQKCGENGEMLLNSCSLMAGYLNDTATTASVVVEIDGEKWLKTGDIGHLDSDGNIYFVERRKRTIKISAVNIFPSEVEKCIKQLPFVQDCCVARDFNGVKPATKLILQLQKGVKMSPNIQRSIDFAVKTSLSKYAVPTSVVVVDQFVTTPLGKIDYKFYEK